MSEVDQYFNLTEVNDPQRMSAIGSRQASARYTAGHQDRSTEVEKTNTCFSKDMILSNPDLNGIRRPSSLKLLVAPRPFAGHNQIPMLLGPPCLETVGSPGARQPATIKNTAE